MASAESPTPTCPVCHTADKVKTLHKAYQTGATRYAPPEIPTRNVSMMGYIISCGVIVGIFIFFIIVFIGGMGDRFPQVFQLTLVALTLVTIVSALVVSYIAFQRVVRGDNEAQQYYAAWDKATEKWNSLYYCGKDNVVFDPQTDKTVSDEQLKALSASVQSSPVQGEAQSALARH